MHALIINILINTFPISIFMILVWNIVLVDQFIYMLLNYFKSPKILNTILLLDNARSNRCAYKQTGAK